MVFERESPACSHAHMSNLTLRPTTTLDHDFALEVTEACMKAYAEQTWGNWNGKADFDPTFDQIIQLDGQDIGILCVEKHATQWQVDKLYILPTYQNQGHGSFLLKQLKAEAIIGDIPIRLSVLQVNPAQRFYARHGFVVIGTAPPRIHMECRPPER
jgi:GNAT superfamily N-acetyltransferase